VKSSACVGASALIARAAAAGGVSHGARMRISSLSGAVKLTLTRTGGYAATEMSKFSVAENQNA